MAQSGFTPIQLYFSTTASATPSAGNLANGELAINITDGRLFYKDNGGTVRVLAGTGGSGVVAGSNTQVQFNNNGVFGASANMTFNGTRLTVADLADSGLTSGRVVYSSTGGSLVDSANLTFDGTTLTANALTTTSTVTINGGTANGVAYLNGSKVLTTGSALTFDGTNLGLGTATPGTRVDIVSTNNTSLSPVLRVNSNNVAVNTSLAYDGLIGSGQLTVQAGTSAALIFGANAAEQMRLTSTGLGIGTGSPSTRLDVQQSTTGVLAQFRNNSSSAQNGNINAVNDAGTALRVQVFGSAAGSYGMLSAGSPALYTSASELNFVTDNASGVMKFSTGGSSVERMRLDSSGNLGLGVTPSAWGTSFYRALQIGPTAAIYQGNFGAGNQQTGLTNNVYSTNSSDVYIQSTTAQRYRQLTGAGHVWEIAPSGTAGNAISFTQAMTLDASGNLGIGVTSPGAVLHVSSAGQIGVRVSNTNATPSDWIMQTLNNGELRWYSYTASAERMRIDTSGNLLVGTTSVIQSGRYSCSFNGQTSNGIVLQTTFASTGTDFIRFVNSSGSAIGNITQNGTSTVNYSTSSDYRLKEDIQPMTGALAKVAALKPCTYKWKADGSDGEGFIAHELAEVVPQCVTGEKDATRIERVEVSPAVPATYDEDGNELTPAVEAVYEEREVPAYQGIDTSFLVATLTAAIQEQQAIITALTARVAALESK